MTSKIEKVIVSISIDTECDHDPDWARAKPLTFHSITEGLPNRLQPAFESVNAIPTYLLTVEVMENEASVAAIKNMSGSFELGTHLHAAFIEPQKKFHDYAGIDSPDFQCSYPPDIERQKLENLTTLFEQRFGYKPTSFRAGRYGANHHSMDALEQLGYVVDSSVTPFIKWQEPNATVDFRCAPLQPYYPHPDNISKQGPKRALLQVPVTMKRRRLRMPRWFRPWLSSVEQMKSVAQWHLKKYSDQPIVHLNMMFHSMEVIPKATPYPQDESEARRFIDDMTQVLRWCQSEGFEFHGLSDLPDFFT